MNSRKKANFLVIGSLLLGVIFASPIVTLAKNIIYAVPVAETYNPPIQEEAASTAKIESPKPNFEIAGIIKDLESRIDELSQSTKGNLQFMAQNIIPKNSTNQIIISSGANTAVLIDQINAAIQSIRESIANFFKREPKPETKIVTVPVSAIKPTVVAPAPTTPSVAQPSVSGQVREITREVRTETVVVDNSQIQSLMADLNAYKESQQKLISELSQISNVGPRGNVAYTIGNPTFTGTAQGLEDDDIPDDITVSTSKNLSAGNITASGNITAGGVVIDQSGQITGVTGATFSDKIKVGTDTIIIDGVNNYIASPSNALSIYTTSTPLAISALTATGTWSSYFTGNFGIGTTTPGSGLSVQATSTLLGGPTYIYGQLTLPNFFATSTTATSTFDGGVILAQSAGSVGIGTSSPSAYGLNVAGNLLVGGTATSSFTNGIKLLSGCILMPDGTCAGGSNLSNITESGSNTGISSTSPGSALEVGGFTVIKGNLNVEATSTVSSLIATSTLSVGTSTPTNNNQLAVQGNAYITQGLGIGAATTSAGGLFVKGSADIYDGVNIRGGKLTAPNVLTFSTNASERARLLSTGEFLVGATSLVSTERFLLKRDANAVLTALISNSTSGSGAVSELNLQQDPSGAVQTGLNAISAGFTSSGQAIAGEGQLYFQGGSLTGAAIRVITSDYLRFLTNDIERARILSTGEFGIGTTVPGTLLDVAGFANVKGNLNISATSTLGSLNATTTVYVATSSPTINSNLVVGGPAYVNSLGVGVATTSPGGLFVKGSADIYDGLVVRGGKILGPDGTASEPGYSFQADTNTGTFRAGADALAFSTGGSERGRFLSSGELLLGLTSQTFPANQALLYVRRDQSSASMIRAENASGAAGFSATDPTGPEISLTTTGATPSAIASIFMNDAIKEFRVRSAQGGAPIQFYTAATDNVPLERFKIDGSGDFHFLRGDINLGNGISATSTISGEYGKLGLGTTSPFGQFSIEASSVVGSTTPIFVIGDQGTSTIFNVNWAGVVGIGTATPSGAEDLTGAGLSVGTSTYFANRIGVGIVPLSAAVSTQGPSIHVKSPAGEYAELRLQDGAGAGQGFGPMLNMFNANADQARIFLASSGAGSAYYSLAQALTISSSANVPIRINAGANNGNHIYIEPDGDVGIGNAAPGADLEVSGAIDTNIFKVSNSADTDEAIFFQVNTNSNDIVSISAAGAAKLLHIRQTGQTAGISLDTSSRVGIGKTGPTTALDVVGTTTISSGISILGSQFYIGNGKTATSSIYGQYGNLGFASTVPYGQFSIEADEDVVGSTTPIFVIGDQGTSSPFIYVNGIDGGVGIGTTTNLAADTQIGAGLSVATSTYIQGGLGVGVATTSAGGLFVKGSADIYDGLIVRGGDVGIGTTSPGALLALGTGNILLTPAVVTTNGGLLWNQGGSWQIQSDASSYMRFITNNIEAIRINSSGSVGIGTTSPATTLSVAGNALITGTTTVQEIKFMESDIASSTPNRNTLYAANIIKAWITFNGQGTPSISDSFNVTSLTDNGVGTWTLNFGQSMANGAYALSGGCVDTGTASGVLYGTTNNGSAQNVAGTSGAQVTCVDVAGAALDGDWVSVIIVGHQ